MTLTRRRLHLRLLELVWLGGFSTIENRTQLPLVLGFTLAHGYTRLVM